jgi:hypothetical protein
VGAETGVLLPPALDQDLGLLQRLEVLAVQKLVSQHPVMGSEVAVSGSDSGCALSQDPAKAREFPGCSR